ncbi:hypothetical protein [Maribacter sp. 2210JD10-5]|uniref:hypothetical protein n=1 Tax=Maribacter sp. 2210JD10-5 TaxID=3386272 RepID=UPI0039BC8BDF
MKRTFYTFLILGFLVLSCNKSDDNRTLRPIDNDGDGVLSDVDPDEENPCIPAQNAGYDEYFATNDVWAMADCDNDGISNGEEDSNGTDPYVPEDNDGDGIGADVDEDDNDPCIPAQEAGYDGFDVTNEAWAEADCDDDDITNALEVEIGTDPYVSDAPIDEDGDGVEASEDVDDNDPCLPAQGIGYDLFDSENTIWANADCDSDGLSNGEEVNQGSDPYDSTSTEEVDNDGDGVLFSIDDDDFNACVPGQEEGYNGFDSDNDTWSAANCDGDSVNNGDELLAGTDPYKFDSDGSDCLSPVNTEVWSGALNGLAEGFETSGVGVPGCGELTINGDIFDFGCDIEPSAMIVFTPEFGGATNGTVEIAEQDYECFGDTPDRLSGSGTYDEITATMVITIDFFGDDITFTITPDN